MSHVLHEVVGSVGLITLNRPEALNALSLAMVRDLSALLRKWRDDDSIEAVAVRGSNKSGVFGAFCAGGDIRFFTRLPWRVIRNWKIFSPRNTPSTT